MERLTKQNIQNNGTIFYSQQQDYCRLLRCETNQKLGKLEDLEEQIGMPLDILLSLLNDTLCVIDTNYKKLCVKNLRVESINRICSDYYFMCSEIFINNYEKNWIPVKQKDILYFFTREEAKNKLEELKNGK